MRGQWTRTLCRTCSQTEVCRLRRQVSCQRLISVDCVSNKPVSASVSLGFAVNGSNLVVELSAATCQKLPCVSLFTGIGGLELGLSPSRPHGNLRESTAACWIDLAFATLQLLESA